MSPLSFATLAAALAAGLSAPVQAQSPQSSQSQGSAMSEAMIDARFIAMDRDGNDFVSAAEYLDYVTASDEGTLRKGQPAQPNYSPMSEAEARERFDRLDRNADGRLDRSEVAGAARQGRLLGQAAPEPGLRDEKAGWSGRTAAEETRSLRDKMADQDRGRPRSSRAEVRPKMFKPDQGAGQSASPVGNPARFLGVTVNTADGEKLGEIVHIADARFSERIYAVVDRDADEMLGDDYVMVPLGDLRLDKGGKTASLPANMVERLGTMPRFERDRFRIRAGGAAAAGSGR